MADKKTSSGKGRKKTPVNAEPKAVKETVAAAEVSVEEKLPEPRRKECHKVRPHGRIEILLEGIVISC